MPKKPGFFLKAVGKNQILTETRFLSRDTIAQKPGFFLKTFRSNQISQEIRFLRDDAFFQQVETISICSSPLAVWVTKSLPKIELEVERFCGKFVP